MTADLIIVSHNSKTDLEKFLPSIKKNTENYTLTIIDNGSNKETIDYLKNCGERVIFQENKGYGGGCNAGAKITKNEIIVFLNCDLFVGYNWLNNLLEPFKDEKVAITGARLFNNEGIEYPTLKTGRAVGCCFAVRRKIFEEMGGFDENFFLFFEETDFCDRVITAGYKVIRSEAMITHYHPHFPPFAPELQKHWDKSEQYFNKKQEGPIKKQDIALVMIVKNEEKGIERAILSCIEFVSEIVIAIDNATTDKTEEIAKKYATTIKHFDWQDDFSKARNFAHEGVKSKWILFLDGHEYVIRRPKLDKYLALDCEGLLCTIEMENGGQFRNPRIYRNGIDFQYKVHEAQKMTNVMLYIEFLIKHERIGFQDEAAIRERNAQRDDQTVRILNEQLKEDPKNFRSLYHLGLYYMGRGKFKEAIKYFNQSLKRTKIKGDRWFIFFNRAHCYLAMNKCFRAFWSASRADDETLNRWEINKLRGIILYQKGKFYKAIESFIESFHDNEGDQTYKPWKRDEAGTWNLIGECFFNLGFYDKASIAFTRAADLITDKTNKTFTEKRAELMREILKKAL